MKPKVRLAYMVSHPIQYQAPLLKQIAAQPHIDLSVLFLSDSSVRGYRDEGFNQFVKWDVPLLEGYNYKFLPTAGTGARPTFWLPWAHQLRDILVQGEYDALWLHGYFQQSLLRALYLAKRLQIKTLLRGESNAITGSRSIAKDWLKKKIFPLFFKQIDAFLAIGSLNRAFYRDYGAPDHRIFMMPYAVDNERFQLKTREALAALESLRAELRIEQGRPVILFASKLLKRKRAEDLLEAYVRLSPDGIQEPLPCLLIVGDGEERGRLEAKARETRWNSIKFLGFQNQSELPKFYALCDVFVLVSEGEPWGLVVNEVMNAAKPVIVSDRVVSGVDLVNEGENGYIIPLGDVNLLADRLERITRNSELARAMGRNSFERINTWSFAEDIEGLNRALDYLLSSGE